MAAPTTLFDVRDPDFAAFAIANGLELKGRYVDPDNGFHYFQFDASETRRIMSLWQQPTPMVNARILIDAQKRVRDMMRSGR